MVDTLTYLSAFMRMEYAGGSGAVAPIHPKKNIIQSMRLHTHSAPGKFLHSLFCSYSLSWSLSPAHLLAPLSFFLLTLCLALFLCFSLLISGSDDFVVVFIVSMACRGLIIYKLKCVASMKHYNRYQINWWLKMFKLEY